MRILVVSDVTGYMRGGVPAATRKLLNGLTDRGHQVGFVGDIPVTDHASVKHFPLTYPAGSRFESEVREAMNAFAPEFVHVMSMSSRGVFALIPLMAGRAWLLTCHSIPPNERKLLALHGNETAHYMARNARFLFNTLAWVAVFRRSNAPHLVVHSTAVASTALSYGQDAARLSIVQLGCDVGHAPRKVARDFADSPFIVTTGGLAHTKGYHDAILAVATARSTYPKIKYQIIGEIRDPSYLAYLNSLIGRYRLEANVTITPDLPDAEKNHALDTADLYIQPSHEEGFCLAYIEAALRVPRLVGTETGAIALISADDNCATVVPTRHPDRLAQAITGLLSKPVTVNDMALRFARLRERFSWTGYLDAHEAIYNRLSSAADRKLAP